MSRPRNVAVDLLSVVPGHVGGAEEYAVRVLSAYAEHGPSDVRPILYVVAPMSAAHPDLVDRFETVVCPIDGVSRPRRIAAESRWLAPRARRADATHHFGGRMPLRTGRPAAVTVHDLQPLDHPERFSRVKAAYLSWALPRSIRRADLVVAISDPVAERIRSEFPVDTDRVLTASAGVARVASRVAVPSDPPTVLYPAATYPHKNHVMLIAAFDRIAERHPSARLALTGTAGRAEMDVEQAVRQSRHGDRIDRPGRVPAGDLEARMTGATVLAFPSSYEGFGLPVLEAMANGVPVIVGAGTPAADLCGAAGWTVDTGDVAGWAEALDRALSDGSARDDMARQGLGRAAEFGWERSAEALERAWRRLLDLGA